MGRASSCGRPHRLLTCTAPSPHWSPSVVSSLGHKDTPPCPHTHSSAGTSRLQAPTGSPKAPLEPAPSSVLPSSPWASSPPFTMSTPRISCPNTHFQKTRSPGQAASNVRPRVAPLASLFPQVAGDFVYNAVHCGRVHISLGGTRLCIVPTQQWEPQCLLPVRPRGRGLEGNLPRHCWWQLPSRPSRDPWGGQVSPIRSHLEESFPNYKGFCQRFSVTVDKLHSHPNTYPSLNIFLNNLL